MTPWAASRGYEPDGAALLERHMELQPTLESPREARRLLRQFLLDAGRSDWLDAGELAISEIVTNGSLHGHTPMEVRLVAYEDRAYVEVRDGNSSMPVQRDYDNQATTGRGMALVSAVTAECGVSSLGADGKVVWFCLDAGEGRSEADPFAAWGLDEVEEGPVVDQEEGTLQVVLASMPATLWISARQHHDAILRELVLHQAQHPDLDVDLAAADDARTAISNALVRAIDEAHATGQARPALPDGHPSPLPWVPEQLDLCLSVPAGGAGGFAALQDVLDVAERLAVAGDLLCRPGLPEIVAVRDWACEQVIAQLSGIHASPWPGTAQERFEIAVNARPDEQPDWDSGVVVDCDLGVIAADEANRIVAISRPLADLLGWDPAELTGRRVVAVIPPALREAHVAGFSRHLTTGEAHVLGVALVLPVLCKDGSEVRCRFLVERAATAHDRPIYLAWISPVDDEPEPGEIRGAA
jgi:PAS domain S-box-containing protein